MRALTGGVFGTSNAGDDFADLRRLAEDIGMRSFDERIGHRGLPDRFDGTAWRHLEDAGLTRLTAIPNPAVAQVNSRWCCARWPDMR